MNTFKKFKKLLIAFIITFLIVSINSTTVSASSNYVYLGGNVLGFTIKTEGATVVGLCDVITENGLVSPCKEAGIIVGDVILNMGGNKVNSAGEIADVLKDYKGGEIVTKIVRKGEQKLLDLKPCKDVNGTFKIGVYLRDDLTGLGTVTYYDGDGNFASLGHPVSDENGNVYKVVGGNVYNSTVVGVIKGVRGKPGELKGILLNGNSIGKISKNTNAGLFGKIDNINVNNYNKIEVDKAKQGKAKIYSTVDGSKPEFYEIDIVKVDNFTNSNKNLLIRICDKSLLNKTGGILQGMSGSPIIQNGKLVGAVTHVMVNDSSMGYGIFIENMLKN